MNLVKDCGKELLNTHLLCDWGTVGFKSAVPVYMYETSTKTRKDSVQRTSGLVNMWRCGKVAHLERACKLCAFFPHLALGIASIWLFLSYILLYPYGNLVIKMFPWVPWAALSSKLAEPEEGVIETGAQHLDIAASKTLRMTDQEPQVQVQSMHSPLPSLPQGMHRLIIIHLHCGYRPHGERLPGLFRYKPCRVKNSPPNL